MKSINNGEHNEELVLVVPNIEYKKQALNLIDEVEKNDLEPNIRFSGFNSLEEYKNNYEEWLKYIEKQLNRETISPKLVTANTIFTIRKKDNKLVGIINIRHELNEYLLNYGGHIGYSILPSERQKGYAYKQLLLGLEFCKKINIRKVLITCAEYNIGSRKTIEKAGGILENIVFDQNKNTNERRYWIEN